MFEVSGVSRRGSWSWLAAGPAVLMVIPYRCSEIPNSNDRVLHVSYLTHVRARGICNVRKYRTATGLLVLSVVSRVLKHDARERPGTSPQGRPVRARIGSHVVRPLVSTGFN